MPTRCIAPLVLAMVTATFLPVAHAADEPGFRSIFNGHSLTEWTPRDPSFWTVENGAIVGRITRERPCTTNQYLVWNGGDLADFELKLEMRLNGEGGINGGFQFRSRRLPDGDVCGYQVDNNLRTDWLARLYDEFGRHDLAFRGERAVFDTNGTRTAQPLDPSNPKPPAHFRLEDWHEYHLTCIGPKISIRVNDQLIAEVEDNDPRRAEPQGILALQLHSGPPTVTEFRNIRLKVLKPARTNAVPDWRLAPSRRKVLNDALAWWLLDSGGHGAHPPLRLNPEFYQFEFNVLAAGTGAVPNSKVLLLDGAYLDAGKNLHASEDQLTVYFRLRDPSGKWNAALIGKKSATASPPNVHFDLSSRDLPSTPGPDITFTVQTDLKTAQVSFPLFQNDQIDPTAWHNLVGRYNGSTLAIYCDGRLMSSQPLSGKLMPNGQPLLIGAELENEKMSRHFHGELDETAIWPRALIDSEIAALNPPKF